MRARIALPCNLLDKCLDEASRTFPLESGGILMGQWLRPDLWQVDYVIGPGPQAHHERFRFSPDPDWQHDRIAERFRATGGRSTYLGDWHSHPNARHGRLSYTDKLAAQTILRSPQSQCERLLMMLVWGYPSSWKTSAWACETSAWKLWRSGVDVLAAEIHYTNGVLAK